MAERQTERQAIGMIELTSIAIGHQVQDAMLKAAEVKLIVARTICSGKYIAIVGGPVGAVQAAVNAGLEAAPDGVIDHILVPNIHPDVFRALGDMVQIGGQHQQVPSLGIVETFSASSAIEAADVAAKAANVSLFRIHLAMALGGKGLVMMAGSVSDCRSAVEAAAATVKQKGLLVSSVVIPRPSPELFAERL
ncbi:BMC domain-containing protein [Fontivita pretiosa]|jgi:microcompartment protein CcmL/EutN|uniref:BMC domain-containing protein n=1 Tax=Fontivita pretiosa TaxID=2989684 RepID=UPI003D16BD33